MSLFTRFPSYQYIVSSALRAVRRFPLTLLSAIITAVLLVYLVEHDMNRDLYALQKLAAVCALGLPLFTALAAFAEMRRLSRPMNLVVQAIGIAVLVLIYVSTPENLFIVYEVSARVAILAVAFHFLVAFLPYLGGERTQGFWQFNRTLFVRFLLSALFAGVMFAGLALALAAAEHLFELDIDERTYGQLWMIIAFVFTTWVFTSGIPEDLRSLDTVTDYPRELRVFAQYILLPLVGLYLVILYLYAAKILFTWNWPKGWVSHLVLWYSVASILSLLLLWPLRAQTENRWIQTFSRWFFRLLVPLIVMLFLAISERVGEYGITVNRYLVIAMACGLSVVVLYFVFSRLKDIRLIPVVVFIVAIVSAFGPWSAFAVSERSQIERLEKYLQQNNIVADGQAVPPVEGVALMDRKEISAIVRYLSEWHGKEPFSRWFSDSTLAAISDSGRGAADEITSLFGIGYINEWEMRNDNMFRYASLNPRLTAAIPLAEYSYLVPIRLTRAPEDSLATTYALDGDTCYVQFDWSLAIMHVWMGADSAREFALDFRFSDTLIATQWQEQVPWADTLPLNLRASNSRLTALLVTESLHAEVQPDSVRLNSFSGQLLLRREGGQ